MTRPHRLAQVLAVDPNFEVVTAAYPYVARSLLADRSPKSRRALLELILDTTGRVRWTRLNALAASAFGDDADGESEEALDAFRSAIDMLGGKDKVVQTLDDASSYLCSSSGARTRAALVDDAERVFAANGQRHARANYALVANLLLEFPDIWLPVLAKTALRHEARRALLTLLARLHTKHKWRVSAAALTCLSHLLADIQRATPAPREPEDHRAS